VRRRSAAHRDAPKISSGLPIETAGLREVDLAKSVSIENSLMGKLRSAEHLRLAADLR
jgi:hypothetical protein